MLFKSISNLILLLCLLIIISCVGEGPLKLKYNVVPENLGDDWTISTPEDEKINPKSIESAYQQFFSNTKFLNGISMLIVRNGKLVAEGYARDMRDRDHYEAIQSMTKSITSLLTGIAKDEGYISSLNQTIYEIYPEKFGNDPVKKNIRLSHLLTMTSGIDIDNENFTIELEGRPPKDSIKYILDRGMYNTPGTEFYYRDCDPHLLSYALQILTGETLSSYAKARLFEPLHITNYRWISDNNNVTYGAYGIYMIPRDLAKIGQLMLQNGNWKGQQLISSEWINESTIKQVEMHETETKDFEYGYYWWIIPELNAFTAWGHGGNYIVVIPDKNIVVVLTSFPNSNNNVGTHLTEFVPVLKQIINGAS